MRARLWLPSVVLLRGERGRGKEREDAGRCPVLPEVTVHILRPIFPSVTSSGARSSKPLRDLSVWLNRCWSLLMSDGTETWVRWTSQSDIVVLVCQQGHSGRGRNWPLPRQQFCHGGGWALSSGCVIFCLALVSLASCRVLSTGMVRGQVSQPVCPPLWPSPSIWGHRGPASSPGRLAEGGFGESESLGL